MYKPNQPLEQRVYHENKPNSHPHRTAKDPAENSASSLARNMINNLCKSFFQQKLGNQSSEASHCQRCCT